MQFIDIHFVLEKLIANRVQAIHECCEDGHDFHL